jgi:serine/threonine protein kinase
MSKEGDVFSIGATIYHLATGRRPEDGKSLDPWAVGFHVPADLRQIILAAVRPTPSARPTVSQLLRAVDGDLAAISEPAKEIRAGGSAPSNELGKVLLAIGGVVLLAKVLDSVFSST